MPRPFPLFHNGIRFTHRDDRATIVRLGEVIKEIMENSVKLSVPLKVELS
jgi:hypothetical protein